MNIQRNKGHSVTEGLPVRYELIDKDGRVHHIAVRSAADAAKTAALYWPDQEQDEDRTGKGWDIQVVGSDS